LPEPAAVEELPPADAHHTAAFITMHPAELKRLEGQSVLVRSSLDTHNPPVGARGWIHVSDTNTPEPRVELVIEYPDMFNEPAHERIIELSRAQLDQLLASERTGAFEFTLDDALDHSSLNPMRVDPKEVSPPR
jgi:hypothetical protein